MHADVIYIISNKITVKLTHRKKNSRWLLIMLLSCILLTNCTNMKKVAYLNNINETEITNAVNNLDPVIQKNDLLSVTVSSPNAAASQPFNTVVTVSTQTIGYTATQAAGTVR